MRRGLRNSAAPNTPEGRKKVRLVGAAIGVAAVLAIAASFAGDRHTSMKLLGVAAGLMFVGVVFILSTRSVR